jgi:hypothetical protein
VLGVTPEFDEHPAAANAAAHAAMPINRESLCIALILLVNEIWG